MGSVFLIMRCVRFVDHLSHIHAGGFQKCTKVLCFSQCDVALFITLLRYKHRDMADLEQQLQAKADARIKMIATDGETKTLLINC